jgi:hypothetical protein
VVGSDVRFLSRGRLGSAPVGRAQEAEAGVVVPVGCALMKISLTIDYSVETDREGETEKEEVQTTEVVAQAVEELVETICCRCEDEGLDVTLQR